MRIVLALSCLALSWFATGCNSACDSAANVLEDKCGPAPESDDSSGEGCEADSEILANCINDNDGKTCAEIQAACFAP